MVVAMGERERFRRERFGDLLEAAAQPREIFRRHASTAESVLEEVLELAGMVRDRLAGVLDYPSNASRASSDPRRRPASNTEASGPAAASAKAPARPAAIGAPA